MRTVILGNMLGDSSGLSMESVSSIYDHLIKTKDVIPYFIRGLDGLDRMIQRVRFDGIFTVTYGGFGNNGTMHEILEQLGIKFNNNNAFTHSNCYNKLKTYKILDAHNILHPEILKAQKFPCVIKPIIGEGGQGIRYIEDFMSYKINCVTSNIIFENRTITGDEEYYLEEYIEGDEYTISIYKGVIGSPIKIISGEKVWYGNDPSEESLDYKGKEDIKALINKDIGNIYDAVGASSGLRIDFRVKDGKAYYFDVNSMPVLNKNGYYLRSLEDFDKNMTFEFVIDDMFNDI